VEQFISPIVLYLVCVLGAAGVALALPRRGSKLVPLGAVLIAGAAGLVAVSMGLRAAPSGANPGFFFYVFAAIGLGASVRMITHPRPVYSALYFILTIIASCGLYLLLGAEFMAFALVIIYAGAILITYLFVIMLATQAPTGNDEDLIDETDAVAREPVVGAIVGFVLMGLISAMLFKGVATMQPRTDFVPDAVLANLPVKVDRALCGRPNSSSLPSVCSVWRTAAARSMPWPARSRSRTPSWAPPVNSVPTAGRRVLRPATSTAWAGTCSTTTR
jgi:NADH:ubiquinone oxidoreductase subunit 6 (subunit J)